MAEISNRVKIMSVNVYDISPWDPQQLSIFDQEKADEYLPDHQFRSINARKKVSDSVDSINNRYGEYIVTPASMMDMSGAVLDRIAFGAVKDMEL